MYIIKRKLKDYSTNINRYFVESLVYHRIGYPIGKTLCGVLITFLDLSRKIKPRGKRLCQSCERVLNK